MDELRPRLNGSLGAVVAIIGVLLTAMLTLHSMTWRASTALRQEVVELRTCVSMTDNRVTGTEHDITAVKESLQRIEKKLDDVTRDGKRVGG